MVYHNHEFTLLSSALQRSSGSLYRERMLLRAIRDSKSELYNRHKLAVDLRTATCVAGSTRMLLAYTNKGSRFSFI